jgi:probable rRNA maturation factor
MSKGFETATGPIRFEIALANQQIRHAVDEQRLIDAARAVLQDSAYSGATISLAVVDDATIHELNRRYLDHDWPTDVLSFVLDKRGSRLQGEVVLSADTADAAAHEHGTSALQEQLLYVVHGMLHLVGYGDKTVEEAQKMRAAEARYLQCFGYTDELNREPAP